MYCLNKNIPLRHHNNKHTQEIRKYKYIDYALHVCVIAVIETVRLSPTGRTVHPVNNS